MGGPRDFRCALPSRAGRTLRVGDQTVVIGHDGVARGVTGEAAAFLSRQVGVWEPLSGGEPEPLPEQAPQAPSAEEPPQTVRLPASPTVALPGAKRRKRR